MAAFHGDERYKNLVKLIIEQTKIDKVIETGTYEGDTTREFAKIAAFVDTIEIRDDFRKKAINDSPGCDNIAFWGGSSGKMLGTVIALYNSSLLFFLDAHWQDHWPLMEELKTIADYRANRAMCVTIIDDFQHPNRPNFFGSNGGGGTIGDPRYGPRAYIDNTPCNMQTFGKYLKSYEQLWFPCYDATVAGYVIASDFELNLSPDAELLSF